MPCVPPAVLPLRCQVGAGIAALSAPTLGAEHSSSLHMSACSAAGLVGKPTTFTMDDLLQLPSVDVTCTLTCAGAPLGCMR